MKTILAVFISLFLFTHNGNAQNKKTKRLLSEIQGQWSLDDKGSVTYTKIIENIELDKDKIYIRALEYFTHNYSNGKAVIQVQDKEAGTIIGKGLFAHTHIGYSLVTTSFDTWHILRIDIKDKRARIILTLTEYNYTVSGGNTSDFNSKIPVKDSFPVNPSGRTKNQFGKAFYGSHLRSIKALESIEKGIKEGNTVGDNDGW